MAVNRLSPTLYKWVKTLHLVFVTMWLGAALALLTGQLWLKTLPKEDPTLILRTLDFIDWYILVPGASGVVTTGVLFSAATQWGWGKAHFWIRAKWIIALAGVIVGTFMLAPWMHQMIQLATPAKTTAHTLPAFLTLAQWILIWGGLQVLSLLYAVYLSVFKPKTLLPATTPPIT